MYKFLMLAIFLFYYGIWNVSFSTNEPLKEGLISVRTYFIHIDSNPLRMPDNLESKIWFQDSCVIYEAKVLNIVTNHTDSGITKIESFDTYKYTYLDLRTLSCQDYHSLSDTALPICSYILKLNEEITWNFYAEKKPSDLAGNMLTLSDTIIKRETYKRIKITNMDMGCEYIYYLNCDSQDNIFHLNRSLEEMYPGCKITRSELRGDFKSPLTLVTEINTLSKKLTSEQKSTFKQWKINATRIKSPILTLEQVTKLYPPPVKKTM